MLITQEEPSGKIYWAIGTEEYFANGDPGHLRKALRGCLSLGSPRLRAASAEASLRTNWVAALPHTLWPGLLNSLPEASGETHWGLFV